MVEAVQAAGAVLSAFLTRIEKEGASAPEPSTLEKIEEGPLGKLGVSVLVTPGATSP